MYEGYRYYSNNNLQNSSKVTITFTNHAKPIIFNNCPFDIQYYKSYNSIKQDGIGIVYYPIDYLNKQITQNYNNSPFETDSNNIKNTINKQNFNPVGYINFYNNEPSYNYKSLSRGEELIISLCSEKPYFESHIKDVYMILDETLSPLTPAKKKEALIACSKRSNAITVITHNPDDIRAVLFDSIARKVPVHIFKFDNGHIVYFDINELGLETRLLLRIIPVLLYNEINIDNSSKEHLYEANSITLSGLDESDKKSILNFLKRLYFCDETDNFLGDVKHGGVKIAKVNYSKISKHKEYKPHNESFKLINVTRLH